MPVFFDDEKELPAARGGMGQGLGPSEPDPSFGDVAAAAFRQENLIGSAVDALAGKPSFEFEPDYNPWDDIRDTDYGRNYADRFVGVGSAAETGWVKSRIDREEADRRTIEAGGAAGVAASIAAGVLDPTILMPGSLALKGVKAGAVARGALGAGAAGAAATAVQEAGLQATQEVRTPGEGALNIAAGTLLGGILGGGAAALSKAEFAAVERKFSDVMTGAEPDVLPPGGASAGAAVTSEARGSGELVGALGMERIASAPGIGSPVTRLQTSEFESARNTVRDVSDAGATLRENAEFIPTSPGGTIENRITMRRGGLGAAIAQMDGFYAQYWFGTGSPGLAKRLAAPARSEVARWTGTSGGKLTAQEFRVEVGRAMARNDEHPVPEVAQAAKLFRERVFDPLKNEAIANRLPGFFDGMKTTGADSYVNRVYNRERIIAQRDRWTGTLFDYFKENRDAAGRKVKFLTDRRSETDVEGQMARERLGVEVEGFFGRRSQARRARAETNRTVQETGADLREVTRDLERQTRTDAKEGIAPYKSLLRDLRRGRGPENPTDLVEFVRKAGGMRTGRYDAAGREKWSTDSAAELQHIFEGKSTRGLFRKGGMDPEQMLVSAIEEGYLPPGATLDDFINALSRNNRGERVFSELDAAAVEYNDSIADLLDELGERGVDVSKATPEELAEVMRGARDVPPSPRAQKLMAEIEDVARAFDEGAVKLENLDALLRSMDESAPEIAEAGRSLRTQLREIAKAGRQLEREASDVAKFADLSDDELRSVVDEVTDTILGNSPNRLAYLDLVAGPRGPLRERVLKIADERIEDFLERDIEKLARIYTRTMSSDIELVSKFGSTDMGEPLRKLQDEKNARLAAAGSDAERTRIEKAYQTAKTDLEALRDRVRGVYKMPDDPNGFAYRAAKVALNMNYLRLLGGMTLSAIPDMARPIMVHGATRVFRDGWAPMVKNLGTFKLAANEVKLAGTALDMVLDTRAQSMADLFDDWQRGSKFERGVEALGSRFGLVSLMAPWNTAMKQLVGVVSMSEILRASHAVVEGKATAKQIQNLAASGIDADMARRISEQYQIGGTFKDGLFLPNTEDWTDGLARDAFRTAIVREVERAIITPGLEKPLWMSTTLGRVVGQFKSFAYASNQKVLVAGLQQRDAAFVSGSMLALGLGALAYWAKSQARGEQGEKSLADAGAAKWAVEAFDNSGLGGIFGEINNISEKMTRGRVGLSLLTGETASRYQSRGAVGALLGPSFDLATEAVAATGSAFSGEWTATDTRSMRKLLPFQNLFYTRRLLDDVEAGFNSAAGVPARAK